MKRFPVTVTVTVALAVALAVTAGALHAIEAAPAATARPTLTGSWKLAVTLPAGASICPPAGTDCVFLALATANSDGTVIQTAPIPNTTIGHGVWTRSGGARSFVVRSTYLRLSPEGALVGTAEAFTRVTLTKDARIAQGTYENILYDLAGAEIGRFTAAVTATRMVP